MLALINVTKSKKQQDRIIKRLVAVGLKAYMRNKK